MTQNPWRTHFGIELRRRSFEVKISLEKTLVFFFQFRQQFIRYDLLTLLFCQTWRQTNTEISIRDMTTKSTDKRLKITITCGATSIPYCVCNFISVIRNTAKSRMNFLPSVKTFSRLTCYSAKRTCNQLTYVLSKIPTKTKQYQSIN